MAHLHIIYKITNKINKKFYIGYHKTKDVNDDYFGSGTYLKRAIKKYGKENFYKEILYIYTNEKEAFIREKELVNKDIINSKLCYNLNTGDHGGFEAIRNAGKNTSCKDRKVIHNPTNNEIKKITKNDLDTYLAEGWVLGFSKIHRERLSEGGRKKIQSKEHRFKNSESKKNAVIMINKSSNMKKFIKRPLIDKFLADGWEVYSENFRRVYK